MKFLLVATVLCIISCASAFGPFSRTGRPKSSIPAFDDLGEPLLVNEVLRTQGSAAARLAAQVNLGNLTSYSGFFTTQPSPGPNNMFWWYFPAQSGKANAPLTIWLQGGPGGSSLFGLFSEMGPWTLSPVNGILELFPREYTWNKEYGMLFIDNPVGAGFSYPGEDAGYCTNTKGCVADNLYAVIQNFYKVFPDQLKVPLYITGESYGGHYVPAFAYTVDQHNIGARKCPGFLYPCNNVPLAGIAVGDGWIDPVNMIPAYPDLLYNIGMADAAQKDVIQRYCDKTVSQIQAGQMVEAFNTWDEMLNGDIYPYPNYFHNITGSNDYDNFLNTDAPESFEYFASYVTRSDIRSAIHVGNAVFNDGSLCESHLTADFHVSFVDELTALLESKRYKIVIYSGHLDIIIGAALTTRFLDMMPWAGHLDYQNAPRKIWYAADTDTDVAGYVHELPQWNFAQVIIKGAGHIAPYDQPRRCMNMIDRMIKDIPY